MWKGKMSYKTSVNQGYNGRIFYCRERNYVMRCLILISKISRILPLYIFLLLLISSMFTDTLSRNPMDPNWYGLEFVELSRTDLTSVLSAKPGWDRRGCRTYLCQRTVSWVRMRLPRFSGPRCSYVSQTLQKKSTLSCGDMKFSYKPKIILYPSYCGIYQTRVASLRG